jgi:hypothetical protein
MTQASYDIIIPGRVRQDKRLGLFEQVLYGEIRGLCRLNGYCWASNAFLAGRMQCDGRSVRRWLAKLQECKHIAIERGDENKNLRKITLTEGRTGVSTLRTPESIPRTAQSAGRTPVSGKGRTPVSALAGGIRKNTNKTPPPTCRDQRKKGGDDDAFLNLPKQIKDRFGVKKTLRRFFKDCDGNIALMQRYFNYADKIKAKNPTGMAVRLAQDYKTEGPPGKKCVFCEAPSRDGPGPRWEGKEIVMCTVHSEKYVELRDAGRREHFAMLNEGLKKLTG